MSSDGVRKRRVVRELSGLRDLRPRCARDRVEAGARQRALVEQAARHRRDRVARASTCASSSGRRTPDRPARNGRACGRCTSRAGTACRVRRGSATTISRGRGRNSLDVVAVDRVRCPCRRPHARSLMRSTSIVSRGARKPATGCSRRRRAPAASTPRRGSATRGRCPRTPRRRRRSRRRCRRGLEHRLRREPTPGASDSSPPTIVEVRMHAELFRPRCAGCRSCRRSSRAPAEDFGHQRGPDRRRAPAGVRRCDGW